MGSIQNDAYVLFAPLRRCENPKNFCGNAFIMKGNASRKGAREQRHGE
jgi:hypothetical protein